MKDNSSSDKIYGSFQVSKHVHVRKNGKCLQRKNFRSPQWVDCPGEKVKGGKRRRFKNNV